MHPKYEQLDLIFLFRHYKLNTYLDALEMLKLGFYEKSKLFIFEFKD